MSGIYMHLGSGPDVISRLLAQTASVFIFISVFTTPKQTERAHSIKLVETHAPHKHHNGYVNAPLMRKTRQPNYSLRLRRGERILWGC